VIRVCGMLLLNVHASVNKIYYCIFWIISCGFFLPWPRTNRASVVGGSYAVTSIRQWGLRTGLFLHGGKDGSSDVGKYYVGCVDS